MAFKPVALKVTINGTEYSAQPGQAILDICRRENINLPTLCFFEGLAKVGACRLCLVEIEGLSKLFPACTTPVANGQKIRTDTERLNKYRRMTTELFFAERNHICAVCVANTHCELQDLARKVGMEHVRFPYLFPSCATDATHAKFILDHNRCILCTRCVRVCAEVEGAHTWDVKGRGFFSRTISDLNQSWGASESCTSCGKCVQVCPTGALWPKDAAQGTLRKFPAKISELVSNRAGERA